MNLNLSKIFCEYIKFIYVLQSCRPGSDIIFNKLAEYFTMDISRDEGIEDSLSDPFMQALKNILVR